MIIKVENDSEKAKSLYEMTLSREKFIKTLEINDNSSTIITENYYEIIQELGTIIFLFEGLKATGESAHREVIDYLGKINILDSQEVSIAQDLRLKRNYSSYEGKQISQNYLIQKMKFLENIIIKLRKSAEKRLNKK
jgi:hypothetical protein